MKNTNELDKLDVVMASMATRADDHDLLNPKNWISPADLAGILGMNVQSVYNRIHNGDDLPPNYKKGRIVRFFRPEVEAWLASGRRVSSSVQLAKAAQRSNIDAPVRR